MTASKPATIANRLGEQINSRIAVMDRFIDPSDFSILRWQEEIAKLANAEPAGAYVARALLAHMMGDVVAVEKFFDQAIAIGGQTTEVANARLMCYSNLGFGTKALDIYREYVDIKYRNLEHYLYVGATFGAFKQATLLMKQASLANVNPQQMGILAKLSEASAVIERWPVSDDQCAQIVDAAGEVLREHKLFWQEIAPKISVNAKSGTVAMRLRVNTTPEFAAEMTMSTADKLINRNLASLPFYVSFVGTAN